MIVYLNGKFINDRRAMVSIHDHGFLYGDGVYETVRVKGGRPLFFESHLKRLGRSARRLRLRIPVSSDGLRRSAGVLIRRNKCPEGVLRITLTRGPGPYGFDPRLCPRPTLVITLTPFNGYPASAFKKGIQAEVVSVRRNDARAVPPDVKSTNCLNGILAKMESLRSGSQEGLMLSPDGFVAEGTVSNVFIVKHNAVSTPSLEGDLLPGVTRERVLRLARKAGYKVSERNLRLKDLTGADEIFLTNTLMTVLPVSALVVGGKRRWSRRPGPVAACLGELFNS